MRGDFPLDRAASPRWLTVPLSKLYGWSQSRYHKSWDKRKPFHASVPVISVGNITVGGTGKTPTVIALAELLYERFPVLKEQNKLAILSRGYGRRTNNFVEVSNDTSWEQSGDEPLLIKQKLPHAAVLVFADRIESANYAVNRLDSKLILLDDGFQHRPINRDIDLVMLDGSHPFGNGRLLPAGPLRERPDTLNRATALVILDSDSTKIKSVGLNYGKPVIHATSKTILPAEVKPDKTRVFLLTAIARPERLLNALINMSVKVVGTRGFMDHHPFSKADIEVVREQAMRNNADVVLTTEKDVTRIEDWPFEMPLITAGYKVNFEDKTALLRLMEPALVNILET